jgi:hypothetical protein
LKAAEAIAINDDEWGPIVDKRLAIDDEILGFRVTNASEIAIKLEIAAQRVEIFDDCADLIRLLRDQVVEFGLLRKLRPITTPRRRSSFVQQLLRSI